MKILYYNWLPFDNAKHEGGGVNVYQKNLIAEMIKNTENDVYFLSSGWKYNPFKNDAYIRETANMFKGRVKSFEIINSPVISPAAAVFNNIRVFLDDTVTLKIFGNFMEQYGPFDVVHINNLEGISINVLKIKEKYPNVKIILSIHNYQTICPLVQYFQNHSGCICHDFGNGSQCLKCSLCKFASNFYVQNVRHYLREKIKVGFLSNIIGDLFRYKALLYVSEKLISSSVDFVEYRRKNIEYINKYADCVLAVSERVREIAVRNGIGKNIVHTSYIGTKFAENALGGPCRHPEAEPFTIAYLGYARIDKGFFFMLDALESINKETAAKIKVKLVVRYSDDVKRRLRHFKNVEIIQGYAHSDLAGILSDVNLGVVPVLWEDNLPQVAMEIVAFGVPVLCSDFGGASELCKSDIFKFKGGDEKDFIEKLTAIVDNRVLLSEYWKCHVGLTTMEKHAKALMNYYA